MSDKNTPINTDLPVQKPGELLKDARENLEITQKEIAAQLNLNIDIIDAIENGADEKLPASTYVRGYLRSYARIVKLDGDVLIRLYENEASGPPEIIPDIKRHPQASGADKPVKAVTYLVAFALALLLIAWIQSNYVVNKVNPAVETVAEKSLEDYEDSITPKFSGPVDKTIATAKQPYKASPPVSGLVVTTREGQEIISEKIISNLELSDDLNLVTGPDESHPADMPDKNLDTLPSSEDSIYLKLEHDSWIEIYDSGNNKLYKDLAKDGEEISLTGIGPFSVLLGYAPGVAIKFNGKLFDTEPYTVAGIARFKLGVQENPE
jgi:cytoskeleton protein RodZ